MSLKAKLEAVIYAAEEPVTLAQLALLFTADALEYKAEQEAAAQARAAEAANEGVETGQAQADLSGELSALGLEPADEGSEENAPTEAVISSSGEQAPDEDAAASGAAPAAEESAGDQAKQETMGSESPSEIADEAANKDSSTEAESGEPDESELKRQARLRDREVRAILRQILDELIAEYATDDRGVEVREIAGGYRMATKPECHDVVRAFVKSQKPALKLSLPALETLAVIAYKQPVTAPEVNEIRGVDSSGVFGSLLARKLIATAGRKQVIGRPILYKTTKEFLMRFGLKDVSELPSMEEFEKMAAIELEEPESAAEGESAAEIREELNEDLQVESDAAEGADSAEQPTESAQAESTHAEVEQTSESEPVQNE